MNARRGVARLPADPLAFCSRCDSPASMTEHCPLPTGSVAFYPYCSRCWGEPGPNAPSPEQRTGTRADTVYVACLEAGLDIDSHESDLYVRASDAARTVLARFPGLKVSAFTGTDGLAWLDVPFAYDPFWQRPFWQR